MRKIAAEILYDLSTRVMSSRFGFTFEQMENEAPRPFYYGFAMCIFFKIWDLQQKYAPQYKKR
jgi:hypothetical protein